VAVNQQNNNVLAMKGGKRRTLDYLSHKNIVDPQSPIPKRSNFNVHIYV